MAVLEAVIDARVLPAADAAERSAEATITAAEASGRSATAAEQSARATVASTSAAERRRSSRDERAARRGVRAGGRALGRRSGTRRRARRTTCGRSAPRARPSRRTPMGGHQRERARLVESGDNNLSGVLVNAGGAMAVVTRVVLDLPNGRCFDGEFRSGATRPHRQWRDEARRPPRHGDAGLIDRDPHGMAGLFPPGPKRAPREVSAP